MKIRIRLQIFNAGTAIFFAVRDAALQLMAQKFLEKVGLDQTSPATGN